MAMANVEFKVSTEQLLGTASEFSNTGSVISNLTMEMMNISNQLSSCSGETITLMISKLRSLEGSIQRMNAMIQEHVSDIEKIVAEYNAAEQTNTEEVSSLNTEIIE